MIYHQDVHTGGKSLQIEAGELERLSPAQVDALFRHLGNDTLSTDTHTDHGDGSPPKHLDEPHQDRPHSDHSDTHTDVHFDSPAARAPELPAGTLNPAFLRHRGLDAAALGNYSQEELHLLFHELGLRGEVESRMGFPGHVLLEGRSAHSDWHNDMAEKHADDAHQRHFDYGYHGDHADAHVDFHLDSNGTHGDHNDLANPHLDTSGQHVDSGVHHDLHVDHQDAPQPDHWDSNTHLDHADAHTDYHCDDHMDHWDHTDVSSKPSFVDA